MIRYFEKRGAIWLDFKGADGKRHRVPSGATTRKAAEKVALDVIAKVLAKPTTKDITAEEPIAEPGPILIGMTLREAYDKALRVRETWIRSKAKGTLKTTFDAITANGVSADDDLSVLTRDKVRSLREAWLQEDGKTKGTKLTPSTVNHRLSMLSVLLDVAEAPPHNVKHLSTKGNRRTRRISDRELAAMAAWCARANLKGSRDLSDMIDLAMDTAARQGELLGLTAADVSDGSATFRNTKNGETRVVPLRDRAVTLLEARRGLAETWGTFFPDLDRDRITALWTLMRKDMGLAADDEFVFHTLRHEAASRLIDQKENAFVVQALLGHASITTTQVYVKVSRGAMERALGIER